MKFQKHGLSNTKIYRTWQDMCRRCFDPRRKAYKNYGGRGITVCDEWRNNVQTFYEYVSKLEHFGEDGYSIDRIDVNGNYEPGNVRWATIREQSRNRTDNHFVELNGEKMILTDAAKKSGVTNAAVYHRLKSGWTDERLFDPTPEQAHYHDVGDGRFLTVQEIADETGLTVDGVYSRVYKGQTGSNLLKPVEIIQRHDVGDGKFLTVKEIAEIAGVTTKAILYRLKHGWRGAKLLEPRQK